MPPVPSRPPTADLRLSLACQLSEVAPAARAVHQFLKDRGCHESELSACELTVIEACNNAVLYVTPENRHKSITIEVTCDPRSITLRVTDHTAGFEWPAHPEFPGPLSQGGRGIPLMHSLMDHVQYLRAPEANILVLQKNRFSS